jgi:hypothetical protein
MPKSFRKGNAFDKPGPSWQYKEDMRQAGAHRAALSEQSKADEEKAILARVTTSSLVMASKKRFTADVRGALRRVKDGQGSTPCTNWARGCDKCKSGRVGDSHHIFCENRGDWKTLPEKDLALQLKRAIESYHCEFWRVDVGSTSGTLVGTSAAPAAAPAAADLAITGITTAAVVAPPDVVAPSASAALLPAAVAPSTDIEPPAAASDAAIAASDTATATTDHASTRAVAPVDVAAAAALQARVEAGRINASALHQSDTSAFQCIAGRDADVYRSDVERAVTREARWMRKEVSRRMVGIREDSSPYPALVMRRTIEVDVDPMLKVDGMMVRARPSLYDHVTNGTSVVVINLATEKAQALCEQAGIGSLPCANPKCCGADGRWHTKPVGWQHQNAAPSIFVDDNGRACPIDVARSQCLTCKTPFYHTNPVVRANAECASAEHTAAAKRAAADERADDDECASAECAAAAERTPRTPRGRWRCPADGCSLVRRCCSGRSRTTRCRCRSGRWSCFGCRECAPAAHGPRRERHCKCQCGNEPHRRLLAVSASPSSRA